MWMAYFGALLTAQLGLQMLHALVGRGGRFDNLFYALLGSSPDYNVEDLCVTWWTVAFNGAVVAVASGNWIVALLSALSPIRMIAKIYVQSRGFGLNFYWFSTRILALDAHYFYIKGEGMATVLVWRPHIDIPPLRVKHWPFTSASQNRRDDFLRAASLRSDPSFQESVRLKEDKKKASGEEWLCGFSTLSRSE